MRLWSPARTESSSSTIEITGRAVKMHVLEGKAAYPLSRRCSKRQIEPGHLA
jgi:hypothetical protein